MKKIEASAPGKIVICGEYAVLGGAPAISMAVNRRARVAVGPGRNVLHSLCTEGVVQGDYAFDVAENGVFEWQSAGGPRVVESVWHMLGLLQQPPLHMHVDTTGFAESASGSKFGFGSSAAVAVSLCSALAASLDRNDIGPELADKAHRQYQNDSGSGVDIATSHYGGLIGFRMDSHDAPTRLDWPSSLRYQVMWSGQAASTTEKLARLPGDVFDSAAMKELMRQSEAVAANWPRGDGEGLMRQLREYTDALIDFDQQHRLGVFDCGHGELVGLARELNVIYKPCGAGGGDTGIVMATHDDDQVGQFVDRATEIGFVALDVSLDERGVHVEQAAA